MVEGDPPLLSDDPDPGVGDLKDHDLLRKPADHHAVDFPIS
jgi:hypothetical protein